MSTIFKRHTSIFTFSVVAIVLLFLCFFVVLTVQKASANVLGDLQSESARLEDEIASNEAYIAELQARQDTLQNKIDELDAQINVEETKIKLTQTKIEKLVLEIEKTEAELDRQKGLLKHSLIKLYKEGNITTIEMLASSESYTDFINQQEYLSRIKDQIHESAKKVEDLKLQLESDKKDQDDLLAKQEAQKNSLAASKGEQQQLLEQTKGEETRYQAIVAENKAKLESALAQQRAYFASLNGNVNTGVVGNFQYTNWSGNQGCGGDGYPYCGIQDSYADPWGLYNRECVSYVAWALSARHHKHVGHFSGRGNAYEWPSSARAYSGANIVSDPKPGDAVVLPINGNFAPIGHVMIVEQTTSSTPSGWIHVSQYNFYGTGEFSTMDIATSGVVFLRFLPAS